MKASATPCHQQGGETKDALTTDRRKWQSEAAKYVRTNDDTEWQHLIEKPDGTIDRREWSERPARHLLRSQSMDGEDGDRKVDPRMSTRIFDSIWSGAERAARAVLVVVVVAIWAPIGAMKGITKIALMNEGSEEVAYLWNRMSPWISGKTWFPWEIETSEMRPRPEEEAEVELDEMKTGSRKNELSRGSQGRGQEDDRRINGLAKAAKRSACNAWKVNEVANIESHYYAEDALNYCLKPTSNKSVATSRWQSRQHSLQQSQGSEGLTPAKKRFKRNPAEEMRMSTIRDDEESKQKNCKKVPKPRHKNGPGKSKWKKQNPKSAAQDRSRHQEMRQEENPKIGPFDEMTPQEKRQESNWRLQYIKKNKSTKNKPNSATKRISLISGRQLIAMVLMILTLNSCFTAAAAKLDFKDSMNSITYDPEDSPGVNVTVFDCRTPSNGTYHAVDVTEAGTCSSKEIEEDFNEPEVIKIHQFQVGTPVAVKVARCQLLLSKLIKWHGWDHGMFHMRDTATDVNIYLSRDVCLKAIDGDRTITCPSSLCGGRASHAIVVPANQTEYASWESRGSYDELYADPESFRPTLFDQDGNIRETGDVVYGIETTTLAVTLEWVDGYVDYNEDILSIPQLDTRANYPLTWIHSAKYGLLAWVKLEYSCKATIGHITSVNATVRKVKEDRRKGDNEYAGAMVIIEDHEEGRASGMLLTDEKHPCIKTHNCLKSNVKSLIACIGDEEVVGVDPIETKPMAQLMRMELAAGLTYVAFTEKVERAELARQIWAAMCLTWETLAHYARVALLDTSNRYNLKGLKIGTESPNMTQQSLVRGSMVYLSNCSAVEASLAVINVCSQQLPILIGEDVGDYEPGLYFADAITKQIIELPTIIKCDETLPVQYKIGQQWHCHSPKHRLCPQELIPSMLIPNIGRGHGLTLEDVRAVHLPLTPKQQEGHRYISDQQGMGQVITANLVRTVLDNSERRVSGHSVLGTSIHLGMPLTKEDLGSLTDLVAGRMFILFKVLGQFYLNIFGFMVVLSLCQYIFNSFCRLWYTFKHNDRKVGWYLLRALFAVLFSSAVLPARILKEVATTVKKQLDEDKEEFIPDPDYAAWRDNLKRQEDQIERIRGYLLTRDDYDEFKEILYPHKELNNCKKEQEAAERRTRVINALNDLGQDSRKNFTTVFRLGRKGNKSVESDRVSGGKAEDEVKEEKPSAPTDDEDTVQGRFDDAQ